MKASNQLKRNNQHLKGAFFSDLDRNDFTNLVLDGVIDGIMSMMNEDELPSYLKTRLFMYANNLQLVQDGLENSFITSKDVLTEKGVINTFESVINN